LLIAAKAENVVPLNDVHPPMTTFSPAEEMFGNVRLLTAHCDEPLYPMIKLGAIPVMHAGGVADGAKVTIITQSPVFALPVPGVAVFADDKPKYVR